MPEKLLDVTVNTRYPYHYSCGTIASEFFKAFRFNDSVRCSAL